MDLPFEIHHISKAVLVDSMALIIGLNRPRGAGFKVSEIEAVPEIMVFEISISQKFLMEKLYKEGLLLPLLSSSTITRDFNQPLLQSPAPTNFTSFQSFSFFSASF
jgi:hypothetical protein